MPETDLLTLWLPILAATIATMVLSTLAWTALPHHRADVAFYPKQDELINALKAHALKPGNYMFPMCQDPKDYKSDQFKAAMQAGPWGTINLFPSAPNMGRNIAITFITLAVIALFVGYLAAQTLPPGSAFARVFQVTATAAVLCHVLGGTLNGVWFGKRLRFFITDAIDGLAYSLATGAIFAALWPAAA